MHLVNNFFVICILTEVIDVALHVSKANEVQIDILIGTWWLRGNKNRITPVPVKMLHPQK